MECLHNSSNINGKYVNDFSLIKRLTCLNNKFKKRKGGKIINTYPYNSKAQLDYILINKKWINSTLNCEAYSSFEGVSSDHRIVTAKICLSLHRNKIETIKTTSYNWSSLTNRDISNKYAVTVSNKFNTV